MITQCKIELGQKYRCFRIFKQIKKFMDINRDYPFILSSNFIVLVSILLDYIYKDNEQMGQLAHKQQSIHAPFSQDDDLMMRVFSFTTNEQANNCYLQFLHEKQHQKWYEIQIKTVQKIQLVQEKQWKVFLDIQFPKQSLRSLIIERKKRKKQYQIEQILHICQLTAQFMHRYHRYICQHTDVYAFIFNNIQLLKICNPKLLYESCNRPDCKKDLNKEVILRQLLQIVLLEKVIELNYWRILRRIHQRYNNDLLDNLIANIMKPEKSINDILTQYFDMKQQLSKISQEDSSMSQLEQSPNSQHPKTPSFTSSFIVFPTIENSPYKTPQKESRLNHYKQEISESMIKEDSVKQILNQHQKSPSSYQQYIQKCFREMKQDNRKPQIKIEYSEYQGQRSQRITFNNDQYFMKNQFRYENQEENDKQQQKSIELYHVVRVEEEGKFQGYLKDEKKIGRGKFYYNDGMYYDGFWLNNKKHGQGSIYYSNNELCYRGHWKQDMQDGEGEMINNYCNKIDGQFNYQDLLNVFDDNLWKRYKGSFRDNYIDGVGTLILSNQETFVGIWRKGKAEGNGEFTTIDGTVIKGIWIESLLESQFQRKLSMTSLAQDSDF